MRLCCIILAGLCAPLLADEESDVAGKYRRIAADHERIVAATRDSSAVAAAGRLTRLAYRGLLRQAEVGAELTADDQHALGQCHKALGELAEAKRWYEQSLALSPSVQTHLSLVRVNLHDDLTAAERHFEQAGQLQPDFSGSWQFHALLATAHEAQGDWASAAGHLEKLLAHSKSSADKYPRSETLRSRHESVAAKLDQVRIVNGLLNQQAPEPLVLAWLKGETTLGQLRGKVAVVEFLAWEPGNALDAERTSWLSEMHEKYAEKGLEVIGLLLDYQRVVDKKPDNETSWEPAWRAGVVDERTAAQYGVARTPHIVVIDQSGAIVRVNTAKHKNVVAELEAFVKTTLAAR